MNPRDHLIEPALPFPIFQISQKVIRYMLYDINTITWLRKIHNILGVLVGTLPQIPQQNVFLGLPLELQPEEARLLIDQGLAFVVHDLDWHVESWAAKDASEIKAIRMDMHKQGLEVAKAFLQNKQSRTQKALEKIAERRGSAPKKDSRNGPAPETDDGSSSETLFDDTSLSEPAIPPFPVSSVSADSEMSSWAITPTTSYPPLTKPTPPSSFILPKVNPASYALFAYLHEKGYFVSPGIRFGCQFSVYPGDPLRFHSHFLAMSYEWEEEIDLLDLVGGGRLGTGVKKGWLLGGPQEMEENEGDGVNKDSVRTFCIEWGGM